MHRFYLPPDQCRDRVLLLDDRESHHALHVLRLQPGDRAVVLDGAGAELSCEVAKTSRREVSLNVLERKNIPPQPFHITLLQAIPRGKILESIIQKATELGATRIVPLLSERVSFRLESAEDASRKRSKWQQVAVEAIKQCGSAWLPQVELPVTPADFLTRKEPFDLPLVAALSPGANHARKFFQEFEQAHQRKPVSVSIWIGPEGDLTPHELETIQASGARPITLGPLVLRSETAAVYCLSILNHELQS
jgi:16S rRNA (uracil1498-N3)-methyltransferase